MNNRFNVRITGRRVRMGGTLASLSLIAATVMTFLWQPETDAITIDARSVTIDEAVAVIQAGDRWDSTRKKLMDDLAALDDSSLNVVGASGNLDSIQKTTAYLKATLVDTGLATQRIDFDSNSVISSTTETDPKSVDDVLVHRRSVRVDVTGEYENLCRWIFELTRPDSILIPKSIIVQNAPKPNRDDQTVSVDSTDNITASVELECRWMQPPSFGGSDL